MPEKEMNYKWTILGWHMNIFKDIKPDITGKYRDYLVRVGPYLAPDWQEVKKMMSELNNS